MIVSRIQLYCGEPDCEAFFPQDGPMDGAIYSPLDLRQSAHQDAGWRMKLSQYGRIDVCPECWAKHVADVKRRRAAA